MHGRRWTREEDATLRRAIAEGGTCREAAEELGRTYQQAKCRCEALGVRGRVGCPPDVYRRARLIGLLADGLSLNAAARLIGVSHVSVLRMARALVAAGALRRVGSRRPHVRYVPA